MNYRSAAIIIRDQQLLLMKRIKNGRLYYVIPGGSREPNETPEAAAEREVFEETRVRVKAGLLLYRQELDTGDVQDYYLCTYLSGEPKLEDSEELSLSSQDNIFEPQFVPFATILELPLVPRAIKEWVCTDIDSGFSHEPYVTKTSLRELKEDFPGWRAA